MQALLSEHASRCAHLSRQCGLSLSTDKCTCSGFVPPSAFLTWVSDVCTSPTPLVSNHRHRAFTPTPSNELSEADPSRLRIEYTDALPLQEFYAIIDEHYDRRKDLQSASELLNRAAHQYRVVEKRLLSRFKDRNPASLDSLNVVSEETYERLEELCDGVDKAQRRLSASSASLGCAAGLVALLARYRFHLPHKDHALLLAHLHPDVTDTEDQVHHKAVTLGWHHETIW